MPRSGYTLPVFACAGAVAALRQLINPQDCPGVVTLALVQPPQTAEIPIDQLAPLPDGSVLAITHSDPGDNLDLTRHTPLWSVVAWGDPHQPEILQIEGGEGVGRQVNQGDAPAIYRYAQTVITHNLRPLIPAGRTLRVTIVLPEGRALAERTSNAAFGVVEGLSLLGTTGLSEPLSAPGQLDRSRDWLRQQADHHDYLVFCLGENGLDLAVRLGINPTCRIKTANWLGPMLVEAGQLGVAGVLLLGYHGKLIKLAGGIFHTHHHVADGRQEILAAHCVAAGVPLAITQAIFHAPTVDAGFAHLQAEDPTLAAQVYQILAQRIDERATAYVQTHTGHPLRVGSMLFNRQRQIVATSTEGQALFQQVLLN